MNRRSFLLSSMAAAPVALAGTQLSAKDGSESSQQYLEWIRFEVRSRPYLKALEQFLENVVIPGLNKLGCSPIGAFKPKFGAHGGDVFLLVPHPSIESFLTTWDKLEDTDAFMAAADAGMDNPIYERMESSLMHAFAGMPQVEVPEAIKGKKGRVFEIRTYEAPNRLKVDLKVEMFNEGGEIDIFRDCGMDPVFFGKTLAGPLMPNLTYMLGFENLEAQAAAWGRFFEHPDWDVLKKNQRYAGTVSTISDNILTPLGCSQI